MSRGWHECVSQIAHALRVFRIERLASAIPIHRRARAQGTKGREVQITVADRGPGIAPKDLPHICEPFYRGQNVAATTSGAGLGLCLVERNLRALGGSVTVKSAPGDGTSFTLHLPVS